MRSFSLNLNKMEIEIKITNEFGVYTSVPLEVTEEEYQHIATLSKSFYINGYEMQTKDGFLVIPPEIVKKSILCLSIINHDNTSS